MSGHSGLGAAPTTRRDGDGSYEHVVLISLDTLRSDCIGVNTSKLWPLKYPGISFELSTPVLDRLATLGTFFPNCIATAPYTPASHASVFTGKWPARHNLYEFLNKKLKGATIFTAGRRLGYRTLFKSDFPLVLGPFLGFTRDVDEYIIEDDARYLARVAAAPRTLSFVHFGGIHVPYGFHNLRYGRDAYVAKIAELEREIGVLPADVIDQCIETYRDAEDMTLLLRYKRLVQHFYAAAEYERLFTLYLEGIDHFLRTRFEPFLERLLTRLEGTRYLLVIFADHGEEWDETVYGHHNSVTEGVIRVPVIFFGPDVPAKTLSGRIRGIDVTPTILDKLGDHMARRMRMDGVSLRTSVWGEETYPEREAYSQAYGTETDELVRHQRRLVDMNRKTGFLRYRLLTDAIYENELKLTRRHLRYTEAGGIWGLHTCDPPEERLERISRDLIPEPWDDAAATESLRERLQTYAEWTQPRQGRSRVAAPLRA